MIGVGSKVGKTQELVQIDVFAKYGQSLCLFAQVFGRGKKWIIRDKEVGATVFIAVHGGIGEDGTLQSMLETFEVPYTGPGVSTSGICMDRIATSLALTHLSNLWGIDDKQGRTKQ